MKSAYNISVSSKYNNTFVLDERKNERTKERTKERTNDHWDLEQLIRWKGMAKDLTNLRRKWQGFACHLKNDPSSNCHKLSKSAFNYHLWIQNMEWGWWKKIREIDLKEYALANLKCNTIHELVRWDEREKLWTRRDGTWCWGNIICAMFVYGCECL